MASALSTRAPAQNYAVYSDATAQSYFAGNVGMGTTSPQAPLDVVGSAAGTQLYVDNGVPHPLKASLGPHCISGDRWAERVAREYHQGVRVDGVIVLLYRDVLTDQWYLAGWWD